jgi:hypothetical protein
MRALGIILAGLVLCSTAAAASSSVGDRGVILVDGRPTFPIALLTGPPLGSTTNGVDAWSEVSAAGVNLLASGPFGGHWWTKLWSPEILERTSEEADAAAAHGMHVWVNLRELSRAQPGSPDEQQLEAVVRRLAHKRGVAMWKGADEPYYWGWPVSLLNPAYQQVRVLDPTRLSLVIQAARGTVADLTPYSQVAGIHGPDIYPVRWRSRRPDLHAVGQWTYRLRQATPNRAVMTTLQVCSSGSDGPGGAFVMPSWRQERFMVYDAIMSGARGLAFFGGNLRLCLSVEDLEAGWNWRFWYSVLRPVLEEITRADGFGPALLAPGTGPPMRATGRGMHVLARQTATDLWVLTSRTRKGRGRTTVTGLPADVAGGFGYPDGKPVPVTGGAFTQVLRQWDVRVVRFARQPFLSAFGR